MKKFKKYQPLETSLSLFSEVSTCSPVKTSFQVDIQIYESGDRILSSYIITIRIITCWPMEFFFLLWKFKCKTSSYHIGFLIIKQVHA